MNRKIALSALSIVGALAVMGGATFAAFSSDASNNGNTFGSGEMVLKINGAAGGTSTPVFAVGGDAVPGDVFTQKLTLENTGDASASAVRVLSIAVGGANPELADKLTIKFFTDVNDDGLFDGGDVDLGSGHLSDPSWANYVLPGVTMVAGDTHNLAAQLTFDADADNTYQNKSTVFNLNFQESQ